MEMLSKVLDNVHVLETYRRRHNRISPNENAEQGAPLKGCSPGSRARETHFVNSGFGRGI